MSPVPEMLKTSGPTGGMTAADKEAQIAELDSLIKNATKRLESLGAVPSKTGKTKTAPDGGPSNNHHVRLRTQLNKTIEVKLKEFDGELAIIKASNFDPDLHELVETSATRTRTRPKLAGGSAKEEKPVMTEPQIVPGLQTRDELLTLTMKVLGKMPEVAALPADEIPSQKEELVEAILSVRAKLKAASAA